MKRPNLFHLLAIITEDFLCIRASLTLEKKAPMNFPRFPIGAIRLLLKDRFSIKILGLGPSREILLKKNYETDRFGGLQVKIPLDEKRRGIKIIQLYEVHKGEGIEFSLGHYLPIEIKGEKKVAICDFDKTLVETTYSTSREVYKSLTTPLEGFPPIAGSIDRLMSYIRQDYHPFILSASPHFYEGAIRDWLYHREIYTAGIFLKDYRLALSPWEGGLVLKDLKIQGHYKLIGLLDILLMTDIPHHLVLIGDALESDPLIYAALGVLLLGKISPWGLWQELKRHRSFRPTQRQNTEALNRLYQVDSALESFKKAHGKFPELSILIRCGPDQSEISLPGAFAQARKWIHLYRAQAQWESPKMRCPTAIKRPNR